MCVDSISKIGLQSIRVEFVDKHGAKPRTLQTERQPTASSEEIDESEFRLHLNMLQLKRFEARGQTTVPRNYARLQRGNLHDCHDNCKAPRIVSTTLRPGFSGFCDDFFGWSPARLLARPYAVPHSVVDTIRVDNPVRKSADLPPFVRPRIA